MAMISDDRASGNVSCDAGRRPRRRLSMIPGILLALAVLLLTAGGCGGDKNQDEDHIEGGCVIILDTTVWDRFLDLATRHDTTGQIAPQEEWKDLLETPAFKAWFKTKKHRKPGRGVSRSDFLAWLPAIFGPNTTAASRNLRKSTGRMIRLEFDYAMAHADEVNGWVETFRTGDTEARLCDLIDRWVAPENRPDSLVLSLLPMDQQILEVDGLYLLNASLVAASPPDDLLRQITGNVYDRRQALPGPDPQASEGEAVVTNIWRLALNEGVKGRLQRVMDVIYDKDHPRLSQFKPIPESIFREGVILIKYFNLNLPGMLAEPENAELWTPDFVKPIRRSNAITLGGYAMAETIVANFGEERLLAVRADVAGFLQAYQEAALLNPDPLPAIGAAGHAYHACMPPFSPEVLAGLLDLQSRHASP